MIPRLFAPSPPSSFAERTLAVHLNHAAGRPSGPGMFDSFEEDSGWLQLDDFAPSERRSSAKEGCAGAGQPHGALQAPSPSTPQHASGTREVARKADPKPRVQEVEPPTVPSEQHLTDQIKALTQRVHQLEARFAKLDRRLCSAEESRHYHCC